MVTSARPQIAEERKRSRWDQVRLTFVVPIGVIVAVAIVCVVVAVLTSAQRADEVSLNREQQLIQQAIAERGARVLREVESVAATERATAGDPHRLRSAMGGAPRRRLAGNLSSTTTSWSSSTASIRSNTRAPLRRRHRHGRPARAAWPKSRSAARTARRVPEPRHSGRRRAESAKARPAHRPDPAFPRPAGDRRRGGGRRRQRSRARQRGRADRRLRQIHRRDHAARDRQPPATAGSAPDRRPGAGRRRSTSTTIADAQGDPIARFAWKPTKAGGKIVWSVLPFIAVAIAGFALLVGLVMRYMRRTAKRIAAGETQLRHLALHDPVCGLPNRIYFGERLESVIEEVRRGGPIGGGVLHRSRSLQGRQRHARPSHRRRAHPQRHPAPEPHHARRRSRRPARRRRVRHHHHLLLRFLFAAGDRRPHHLRRCARPTRSTATTSSSAPRSASP